MVNAACLMVGRYSERSLWTHYRLSKQPLCTLSLIETGSLKRDTQAHNIAVMKVAFVFPFFFCIIARHFSYVVHIRFPLCWCLQRFTFFTDKNWIGLYRLYSYCFQCHMAASMKAAQITRPPRHNVLSTHVNKIQFISIMSVGSNEPASLLSI